MAHIELERVCKTFRVTRKQKGLAGAVKGLFRPDRREVHAVRDVSFAIEPGELVGFIGPNGAGKSTTIKMLSGILYPTSGRVSVVGLSPQRQRRAVVQRIGAVFGQRSQLNWDLRLGESYELFKRIYRIADDDFERSLAELCEVLGIERPPRHTGAADVLGATHARGASRCHAARARHPVSRRAYDGHGYRGESGDPGLHPRHQPAPAHHRAAHHARPGRCGRTLRAAHHHQPGTHHRRRASGGAHRLDHPAPLSDRRVRPRCRTSR